MLLMFKKNLILICIVLIKCDKGTQLKIGNSNKNIKIISIDI